MDAPMRISLFHSLNEDEVAHVDDALDTDWEGIAQRITKYAWAPGLFKDGHRKNVNLEAMDLFVCDVDSGCTIEEAKKIFAPYQCIIGLSKSHQKTKIKPSGVQCLPCDRFRVVLKLAEPITNDLDFKATWFEVQKLCSAIDPACKDGARFYYPCTEIVSSWEGGTWPVTKHVAPEPKPTLEVNNQLKLTPSRGTMKFLIMGAEDGLWHGELVKACIDLKQQQWTQDEATSRLKEITGELDNHDLGVIEDIWNNRDPRHPPRHASSEATKKLVAKCHLMQNIADRSDYIFVDQAAGETHNIDIERARRILGKEKWFEYMGSNKLDVIFTYNPYLKPLTPDSNGVFIYNTYLPATWRRDEFWFGRPIPRTPSMPEIYDRFFTHLTAGHSASKEYLLDWMAHSLRARNFTILTAIGNQGVGKGILAEIFKHLHGESNYCQPKDDVFKERFNAPLKNRTLINVDEISLKTKEEHDRLKAVVNETLAIEEKGVDATEARNFASFYISSNHLDAIQVEPGDRRFSIIQLAAQKIIETDLSTHIDYLTSPEGVGELGRYLIGRPITHKMLEPFRSPRFEEVRLAGLNDWELFMVEEFCPANAGKTHPISFVLGEIKEALDMRALGRRRLVELSKRFPEKFRVIQDPLNRGKRLVSVVG